jgi:hypothetical protein
MRLFAALFLLMMVFVSNAQTPAPRQLPAKRTTTDIKIDGNLDESIWKETIPATQFIEWRPTFGAKEDSSTRTEIYLVYDNTSIYVAGYCHERTKDSVSKELVGRDKIGVNDYVGVIFDTYHDKINGFGFYVTPLGEQFDAKYSTTNGEDGSWSAVWDNESKLVNDGWTFEMHIPYSAIRFVSSANQTWGLNITRNRKKVGKQFMWNPVNPNVNGFINQSGEWTGIEKIEAPLRLSLSPYLSSYINHYPDDNSTTKNTTTSINGGMDVKYGISPSFTLDMTLIPDFGQVRSDNKVLNLSPFEVKYNENRPFFTEGTELFNKGNLFYSRRIGGTPIHAGDIYGTIASNEEVIENPQESKLINATKISGRTKKGLGVGFFNAVTKRMFAKVEDDSKHVRKVETNPLTNYNILVLDQSLKNNSSISFINTNVLRSGGDLDANVSAALFNFNNKKNTYNLNGKFSASYLTNTTNDGTIGYSHNFGFGKTGKWNFQISEELVDDKYNNNDLGILYNNNYFDHYFWTAYRWQKPTNWYNRIQVNYNASHSMLYKRMPGQKVDGKFQSFSTNINANIQLKSLWWFGVFVGYVPKGNDFYEPRNTGYSFRTPIRRQFETWFESNFTKKYYINMDYFVGLRSLFNSPNHSFYVGQRYRFSDKFSISEDLRYNPAINDAGYYSPPEDDINGNPIVLDNIVFTRRNLKTIENILSLKYSFNNKSGITFRARHYWSKVEQKELYDLKDDGTLTPSKHAATVPLIHKNFNIFNIDAVYTLQFAPGSFLNIVWKDEAQTFDGDVQHPYFKNFDRTISAPQSNNLSFKLIYYLDYLDFKKWSKKSKNLDKTKALEGSTGMHYYDFSEDRSGRFVQQR